MCSACGLVLESHSIDETFEWRFFDSGLGDYKPVRVGGPTNPLLVDSNLCTFISKPNGVTSDSLSLSLGLSRNRSSYSNPSLITAFKTIGAMSNR